MGDSSERGIREDMWTYSLKKIVEKEFFDSAIQPFSTFCAHACCHEYDVASEI